MTELSFAAIEATSDNKAEVICGVSAGVVGFNVVEGDVVDGFDALMIEEDVFAERLLDFRPEEAVVLVLAAGEFAEDVAFFALEFGLIEFGRSDGITLKFEDAIPLEVGALGNVVHRDVASESVVVGAVFGELGLVSMLVFEFCVCAESEMLHDVGGFVFGLVEDVAVAGTEIEMEAHDGGVWDVN